MGAGEVGELGDGVEGGRVGDQLGGERVREQGENQLVGSRASQCLLQETVSQAVHVTTDPPQHSLHLAGVLAGSPSLSPGSHQETSQLARLTAPLLARHPGLVQLRALF